MREWDKVAWFVCAGTGKIGRKFRNDFPVQKEFCLHNGNVL